jgi:hypothetical protein
LYITSEVLSVIPEDGHNLIDTTEWWGIIRSFAPGVKSSIPV